MPRRKQNIKNYKKYKKIIKKRKVFGIGLSKTGTSSLALALSYYGYYTKDYSIGTEDGKEMMVEIKKPTSSTNYQLSVLNDYDAITDIPAATWFEQYDMAFPGSKFILTMRDLKDWLDSTQRWWATNDDRQIRLSLNNGFIKTVTYGVWEWNRERFKYVYLRHHREVVRWFKKKYGSKWKKHLLIINVINDPDDYEKWKKIAKFLKLPDDIVPKNKMFPHTNINTQIMTHNKKLHGKYNEHKLEYIIKHDKTGKYKMINDRWRRFKDGNVVEPNLGINKKQHKE